jgi:c-di-AMP phosphodiesterase-like protein
MMAPDVIYELLSAAFGTAFGAGGAYFMIKQSRRDVNGLGRKMNSEIKRSQARWQNLSLALMTICTAEQRREIADLLKESPEGDAP